MPVAEETNTEKISPETMTEEQADAILNSAFKTPEQDKQTDTPAPEDKVETASEPVSDASPVDNADTKPAKESVDTPVVEDDWKTKYEKAEATRKSYDGIVQKHIREAEELRAQKAEWESKQQQYQRIDTMLQDPNVASALFAQQQGTQPQQRVDPNFDYTDPAAIQQMVRQTTQTAITEQMRTAEQQRQSANLKQAQMNFNIAVRANKVRLASERGVDLGVVDTWEKKLQDDLLAGNISQVAERYANFDALLAKAKQDGAVEERARISKLKDGAIRTGSASSGAPQRKTGIVDFTKLDPSSPEYDIELKKAMKAVNFT